MAPLAGSELLDVWERGDRLHPLDRGLLVLRAALPEAARDNPADWPLGRRNAALARLRCTLFGRTLECWITCPHCEARLEFAMDASLFASATETQAIEVSGVSYRLPTSRDLAAVVDEQDPEAAARLLLESCRLGPGADQDLTAEQAEAVGEKMAEADPLAEILIDLQCSECGNGWREPLDLTAFLWADISSRARRLLSHVHRLATAYGWSEREILGMTDERRSLYVRMVSA